MRKKGPEGRTSTETTAKLLWGRPRGLALLAAYKGVWGTVEIAAGAVLFVAVIAFRRGGAVAQYLQALMEKEQLEDPQDRFVSWLVEHLPVLISGTTLRVAALLVILGVTKIALATGLWYRWPVVRRAALVFYGAVAIFGAVELARHFSAMRAALLVADLLIILYLWKFLPQHLAHAGAAVAAPHP